MPRLKVPSRPFAWPRVAVLALAGVAVAGCENSNRFDSNPFASNPPPRQETTGSISQRPASRTAVVSQPLPAPSRPETVAANGGYGNGGYASGAHGLGAYRPGTSDVTGSVPAHPAPPPVPAGHWTWDGGQPVTIGHGETLDAVARKNGVPLSALMEVNGITNVASIRPGQRLVIPRYVSGSAAQASAPPPAPAAQVSENVHVVGPGESLIGIARNHGVTLTALAHANNIQPYDKVSIGSRLTIPGQKVAMRQAPAPKVAQPRTVATEKVATVPAQTARVAKPEAGVHETEITKTVEPEGAIPSFRWPVKGRIIAAFGQRPNGVQNDGINLAVPEGTPVKAADDGVVAYAGNELKGYGNLVLIRHSNGYVSAYANASELMVKRGDNVKRGQVIAHAGQTGNVTSPQLHFEIRKGSTPVDPTKYLGGA
jgi:murein DD-endopeptidase MepM/ murein hydrolase activator NlpD